MKYTCFYVNIKCLKSLKSHLAVDLYMHLILSTRLRLSKRMRLSTRLTLSTRRAQREQCWPFQDELTNSRRIDTFKMNWHFQHHWTFQHHWHFQNHWHFQHHWHSILSKTLQNQLNVWTGQCNNIVMFRTCSINLWSKMIPLKSSHFYISSLLCQLWVPLRHLSANTTLWLL